ncbi:MAG TPA: hypothetical protein DD723_09655 [Candidatus Omnitrophica bacterium]|nr:MAG: hypothetical protein A2Z81_03720 [Omnitrophica WOR_2 bacterium GWA2_45_18]HBR15783.1 hypothetical protein [Candidatus Omnitrophota bacterium]
MRKSVRFLNGLHGWEYGFLFPADGHLACWNAVTIFQNESFKNPLKTPQINNTDYFKFEK